MNRDYAATQECGPKCGCCDTGHLVTQFRRETFEHETENGRVMIEADRVPISVCDTCKSVFVTGETAKVRHEYVCRKLGLITPDEIRAIRNRHGLKKAEFARITQFGESSISRWESGRLFPNASGSKYLKLLPAPPGDGGMAYSGRCGSHAGGDRRLRANTSTHTVSVAAARSLGESDRKGESIRLGGELLNRETHVYRNVLFVQGRCWADDGDGQHRLRARTVGSKGCSA